MSISFNDNKFNVKCIKNVNLHFRPPNRTAHHHHRGRKNVAATSGETQKTYTHYNTTLHVLRTINAGWGWVVGSRLPNL